MTSVQAPNRTTSRTYAVTGMTCQSCEARVKTALENLPEVESAVVDKTSAQASVTLHVPVATSYLQAALGERYHISDPNAAAQGGAAIPASSAGQTMAPTQAMSLTQLPAATPAIATAVLPTVHNHAAHSSSPDAEQQSWWATYRPLLTIVGLVVVVSVLAQAPFASSFDGMLWMRHFMAGFFTVLAGFKLLDIQGFSDSYAMYDVLAKRWNGWGKVYPFAELGLGLAYLTNFAPYFTNVATLVILGISSVGVIQSVLQRRTIQCACLGAGFNLPMSTVTIIEDLGMVAMAAVMFVLMS